MIMKKKKLNTRYSALDVLRGIALISMILYHATWDIVYLFGVDIPFFKGPLGFIWQRSICYLFILLSGFCFPLGRRKLKRALTVLGGALCIFIGSALFMPSEMITFGILCLLGSAMLILIPLEKLFVKIPPFVGLSASLLFAFLTASVRTGYFSLFGLRILPLPQFLYANLFTAYLGFPPTGFSSGDYYPLIPWIFLFFAGFFLYRIFSRYGLLRLLGAFRFPPLEWIDRHTLPIYILHQPIIYGILFVFFQLLSFLSGRG